VFSVSSKGALAGLQEKALSSKKRSSATKDMDLEGRGHISPNGSEGKMKTFCQK